MRRVIIVGSTGSGKSTLARRLAEKLDIPHVELDFLNWEENWQSAPDAVFRERVRAALSGDGWVADGNYSKARDLIWSRADTLIWLDYDLPFILWRLFRRTLRRVMSREKLWGKNRETWRNAFFSRESIFMWALKTHGRHRREYPVLFTKPEYSHLRVIHLRSARETDEWIRAIPTKS